MRKNLVNEQQPFGRKFETEAHRSTMATPKGMENRPGSEYVNGNNGRTVVESFADKNPGAYEYACRNRDNAFAFVGKNFGVGKTNLTDGYSNAN